ncbi:MAG: serine/threonine protein kinase [Polyangiaceae bacterium]|nr:serine/threonine protein kinase [Polyangiaceae bacterium]MCW5790542.1 serine/threonine protein kinase [Polyangiaceae bacterium]
MTRSRQEAQRASEEAARARRAAELSSDGGLESPEEIANYTVLARIGQGGMANVYLARQWGANGFARNVALKVLPSSRQGEPRYVRMFHDEARLGALIDHPNVCRVLDFGEAGGVHYIALEYLVGEPLSRVLTQVGKDRAWIERKDYHVQMARALAGCCEGLHAAHQAVDTTGARLNVVHRDVSPHNLVLLFDGSVRVVDFGVARYDQREHPTTTRMLRGKVAYMSPEHITGGDTDARADVWSMGVVLWEVLTGARLFRRSNDVESMRAVVGYPVPHPAHLNEEAPGELCQIALRALQRNPAHRYRNAAEMAEALHHFASGSGCSAGASGLRRLMGELFEGGEREKFELLARFKGVAASGVFSVQGRATAPSIPSAELPCAPQLLEHQLKDNETDDDVTRVMRGDRPELEPTALVPAAAPLEPTAVVPAAALLVPPAALPDLASRPSAASPPPSVAAGLADRAPDVASQPSVASPELTVEVPLLLTRRKPASRAAWLVLVASAVALTLIVLGAKPQLGPTLEQRRAQPPDLPVHFLPVMSFARGAAEPPTLERTRRSPRLGGESPTAPLASALLARAAPSGIEERSGSLQVLSPAPVWVYQDGRYLGVTPLTVKLPEGTHALEIRYPDGRSESYSVRLDRSRAVSLWLPE